VADAAFSRRGLLAGLLLLSGALEVQGITQIMASQTRLRNRAVAAAREALLQALDPIKGYLFGEGPQAQQNALALALRTTGAAEAELYDPSGRLLLALPRPAALPNQLSTAELAGLKEGRILLIGPIMGPSARVIAYTAFETLGPRTILRLSTAVPEVVADLRERERSLAGHVVALLALVFALVLVLAPRPQDSAAAPPRALDAFAEAMGRLGEQERVRSAEHAAERERLERTVQDQEPMAWAGELAAGIVHEVRNGLGTILGYARLLEAADAPESVHEEARGIRAECETLEVVIRRFTDFIQTQTLNVASFDLRRMLSRVASRECKNRPGPPVVLAEGEMGTLAADEDLLERAFENLVRNGREAAGAGGSVTVSVARDEAQVAIAIADDGPGFGAQERESRRLFYTTKPKGLGLGLPTARKIIELHEGNVRFEDRVPRGLTVKVTLPAAGPQMIGA
jgi:signal transduction histidine kinase